MNIMKVKSEIKVEIQKISCPLLISSSKIIEAEPKYKVSRRGVVTGRVRAVDWDREMAECWADDLRDSGTLSRDIFRFGGGRDHRREARGGDLSEPSPDIFPDLEKLGVGTRGVELTVAHDGGLRVNVWILIAQSLLEFSGDRAGLVVSIAFNNNVLGLLFDLMNFLAIGVCLFAKTVNSVLNKTKPSDKPSQRHANVLKRRVLSWLRVEQRLSPRPLPFSLGQREKFICSFEVFKQIMHKIISSSAPLFATQPQLQATRKENIMSQIQRRKYHHEESRPYHNKTKFFNQSLEEFESDLNQISLQASI